MKKFRKAFLSDRSGNVGAYFAIAAVPLMIGMSVALQNSDITDAQQSLTAALDFAALATVSDGTLKTSEYDDAARASFLQNYTENPDVEFRSEFENGVLTLFARADVYSVLGGMIGREKTAVSAVSSAMINKGRTICVLSLAEDGAERFVFKDNMGFSAPNCAVQVNSKDPLAFLSASSITPLAESFCVQGGGKGLTKPPLNSECAPIADPYKDLELPSPGACVSTERFRVEVNGKKVKALPPGLQGNLNASTRALENFDNGALPIPQAVEFFTGSNIDLKPGTYCGGLTVDGINVTFPPGEYIFINGPLKVLNSAEAYARDVTFVLHGAGTSITVESGAQLYMKAPQAGPLAGIAIAQTPPVPAEGLTLTYPTGKSVLASGGKLDVIGTVYLPTQMLEVSGKSTFGARSPATSFITYSAEFSGDTRAAISTEYQSAGVPPLEPRVDDAPRLVK